MRVVIAHTVPLVALTVGMYGYWFGVADRYAIFLYDHLGAAPFDPITKSRYWMVGLVVGGIIQTLILPVGFVLGRLKHYRPPAWWKVWLAASMIVFPAVILIASTVNSPILPLVDSLKSAAAACIGLGLAILPVRMAAEQPSRLLWLSAEGSALGLFAIAALALDVPFRGNLNVTPVVLVLLGAALIGSAAWLSMIAWLRRRFDAPSEPVINRLIGAACVAYLILPLIHHLFSTPPGYKYITASANFFAINGWVQSIIWLMVLGIAWMATRLSRKESSPVPAARSKSTPDR